MQNKSFLNNLLNGISKRTAKMFDNPYGQFNISPVKLKYLKHLPAGPLRTHTMLGGTVHYINPQELLHALDEIFIQNIYQLRLPSEPYIIDCGANIGMSVIYLKKRFPDARILAFEPDAKNFELLEMNVSSFKLNNVTLKQEAVWNESGIISFASEGSMSSKIDANGESAHQIKAIRLKDHLDKKVNFLKIDIEGAEYAVLKDIEENLDNVDHLFLEYHGTFSQNNELVDIFHILQKAGFTFYIKEATSVYEQPFTEVLDNHNKPYDLQLNIFCFRRENH